MTRARRIRSARLHREGDKCGKRRLTGGDGGGSYEELDESAPSQVLLVRVVLLQGELQMPDIMKVYVLESSRKTARGE